MACDCEVRLDLPGANPARLAALAQIAIDEVLRIERKYSRYTDDSVIARINRAAGMEPVAIDGETCALFDYADTLFAASDGLFDITSGVLRRAWDFRTPRLPTHEELVPLLALIGWQRVERTSADAPATAAPIATGATAPPGTAAPAGAYTSTPPAAWLRLPQKGMQLDLGGFGKEYAADRAATLLLEQGINSGYVNLGGDLRIFGPQADGQPWTIGIQHPRQADAIIASLPVGSGALATSGDYERFFELDGKRYCHILNPGTGYPVTCLQSVSVLAPVAIAAGSYATLALLKQEQGLAFLRESGLAFLAVDAEGGMHHADAA
jgi:thiamine biosynthesis lipoprotein